MSLPIASLLQRTTTLTAKWYSYLVTCVTLTLTTFFGKLFQAFFKNNCKDCFILFELKNSVPFVDFKIVFKKPHDTEIDYSFLEHCNPQYHELVEDFINACTSHMWSAMMS